MASNLDLGHGIINVDGDLWRVQRKAGLSFLNTAKLRVLMDIALPRYLQESINSVRAQANGTTVVDLQLEFHEITTKLMGKMAYNVRPPGTSLLLPFHVLPCLYLSI
jgi:hypothetical protein